MSNIEIYLSLKDCIDNYDERIFNIVKDASLSDEERKEKIAKENEFCITDIRSKINDFRDILYKEMVYKD